MWIYSYTCTCMYEHVDIYRKKETLIIKSDYLIVSQSYTWTFCTFVVSCNYNNQLRTNNTD